MDANGHMTIQGLQVACGPCLPSFFARVALLDGHLDAAAFKRKQENNAALRALFVHVCRCHRQVTDALGSRLSARVNGFVVALLLDAWLSTVSNCAASTTAGLHALERA